MSEAPKRYGGAFTRRLGFRSTFVIAMVLLPLAVVTGLQSDAILREARARSEAALAGATLRAAAPEIAMIQQGRGAAQALAASVPYVVGDTEACMQLMRSFVIEAGETVSFAGYIPADGLMVCGSIGRPHRFGGPAREALLEDPRPAVTVNARGEISGQSVMIFSHPVFDAAGDVTGFVSVSIPHSTLRSGDAPEGSAASPLALITFDEEGDVLTASIAADEAATALPAGRPLEELARDRAITFTGPALSGERRTFSVVPLAEGELFALGTWPAATASFLSTGATVSPYLLPFLMWTGSLIAAIVAIERLVARHIRRLRRSITAFAGGDRLVGDLDFATAPTEIREAAEAFEQMTETILHDEAELEDMVHQKEVLLREVHHRVKNNLQLIASIMNMQIRQTRSPEAKFMIQRLQERVMSLATVHRGLYQTSGLTDVRADELLPDIVRQIVSMASGPGRRFEVSTEVEDIRLTPDQAVPLSLLLTEALTNAIKYAAAPDTGRPKLEVALKRVAGDRTARLDVINSAAPGGAQLEEPQDGTGLGVELVSAFTLQLGGHLEREREGGVYRLSLIFNVEPLAVAEHRNQQGAGG